MILKLTILAISVAIINGQFFKPPGLGSLSSSAADLAKKAANVALNPEQLAQVATDWTQFSNLHKYATPEEAEKRKNIFTDNWKKVTEYAQEAASGKLPFNLKLTSLADLLPDEFNKFFNGYGKPPKRPDAPAPAAPPPVKGTSLPESIDWREKGAVTPVKNQNKCAGCYAFSATGALEGQAFRKTGILKELSPQNLIDCTKSNYSNWGCLGGYVDESFNYVKDIGIDQLSSYPFDAKDGDCKFAKGSPAAEVKGFVLLPEGDEKALAEAVATKGPVSVAIDASQPTMQLYGDGVYYDEKCKNGGGDLNHAVLVVGYGVEADGTKYWIVKNSYGAEWGQDGYIKIAKDRGNHCGIATAAYYPII